MMIVLSFYTMYKRGLTVKDLFRRKENRSRSAPPSQYPVDNKQIYEESLSHPRSITSFYPAPAAVNSRSSSLSTQTLLKPLGRSDRYVNNSKSFNMLLKI